MSSEVKANKLSPATGTALQISDSGDTTTIPSGATLAIASGATIANRFRTLHLLRNHRGSENAEYSRWYFHSWLMANSRFTN